MKRYSLFFGCLAAASFTMQSCKKAENSNAVPKSSGNPQNLSRTAAGFDFEQYGISHNNFLTWMDNQQVPAISDSQQYTAALSYVDSYFGNTSFSVPLNDFLISVDSVENWSERTIDGTFNSQFLVQQNLVSSEMGTYLNQLATLFHNAGANRFTPTQFSQAASDLEDWVIANQAIAIDSSYNCNDGAAMLAITSIAKHSYSYWYNKFGVGQVNGSAQARIFDKLWTAIKVAACDAYGFVVDGWIDTDNSGSGDTWNSKEGVKGASIRSWNASF